MLITLVGTILPFNPSEARKVTEEYEQELKYMTNVQSIFGNNFMHCLIMFTPFIGPFYGLFILYNTGRLLAALATNWRLNPFLAFIVVVIFPHAWMEFLSYALAMSQSVLLAWRIMQRRFKAETVKTCILITICALLLLLAAVIEVLLIMLF